MAFALLKCATVRISELERSSIRLNIGMSWFPITYSLSFEIQCITPFDAKRSCKLGVVFGEDERLRSNEDGEDGVRCHFGFRLNGQNTAKPVGQHVGAHGSTKTPNITQPKEARIG